MLRIMTIGEDNKDGMKIEWFSIKSLSERMSNSASSKKLKCPSWNFWSKKFENDIVKKKKKEEAEWTVMNNNHLVAISRGVHLGVGKFGLDRFETHSQTDPNLSVWNIFKPIST